jgi:hypothetical protein
MFFKMEKKNLGFMLGAALGVMAVMPGDVDAQTLRIINFDASRGAAGVSGANSPVNYTLNGANSGFSPGTKFQMYDLDSNGAKYSVRGFSAETNNSFVMPLSFGSAVTNNTPNWLRFTYVGSSTNPFSQDLIISSMLIGQNYTQVVDVVNLIKNGTNAGYGDLFLPNIDKSGANPYATNYLLFTRKDSSRPLEEMVTNGNVTIGGVLPSESVELQTNVDLTSSNWSPMATNYVPVNADNFGKTTSTTFSNDFSAPAVFYRTKVQ